MYFLVNIKQYLNNLFVYNKQILSLLITNYQARHTLTVLYLKGG